MLEKPAWIRITTQKWVAEGILEGWLFLLLAAVALFGFLVYMFI